jgi:VWFA-related protein
VATLGTAEGARLRDPLGIAYDLGIPLSDTTGRWGLMLQSAGESKKEQIATETLRDQALQMVRAERDQYRQRVAGYVGEIQRLAEVLDSVQGRKQVILLSGGFDQTVLMGATAGEQAESSRAVTEGRLWEVQGDRHFGDSVARSGMDAVFTALARSDTVLHTVDVGGLSAGSTGSLDEIGAERRGSGRETLAQMAGRSGGRFLREANDLAGALRDVLDTSRHYYVLAFEPRDSKKAGDLRKVRVKVGRPGLEVSHRAGYTLPDPKAPPASRTRQMEAAEIIAKGLPGGALRLHAVAMPYRSGAGRVSLPVVLEIDGETLLARDGKKPLALEVYGYAFDQAGRIQDAVGLTPTLDLAQVGTSIRAKGVQVLTSFRVKEGPVEVRFLVRDPGANRAGSVRIAAVVPRFADGALVLSSPLAMDDPRTRVVIPTPSRAQPGLEIPFRVGDVAFTPHAAPVLSNGQTQDVCVMAFGPIGAPSSVKTVLIAGDGASVALESGAARFVKDADQHQRVVVSLTPKGVPAGDYRLRLTVQDGQGRDVTSETPVRVI